jgi:predicted amidohydrolase
MQRYLAAAIQLDSQNDKEKNLKVAEEFIDEAASKGAKLIGLPEMMNFIGNEEGEFENAESIPGPTIERMAFKAKKYKIWLHCGSIFEKIENEKKLYNTTVFLNPDGKIAAIYRKIHLFDVNISNGPSFKESSTKKPGDQIVVTNTDLGKIGFSICYDMRFSEIYKIMALKGAQIIFVPAEFTLHTGKDHWEPLLRARAIENLCYVIAPAQIGVKTTFQTYGKSMIIDPWGNVIARASDKPSVILSEIDLNYLESVRKQVPSLTNRRPSVYKWDEI